MEDEQIQKVIEANIAFHSSLAEHYNTCEPHFRPENVQNVEKIIARMAEETSAKRLLDLGCGTGFIINIAKKYVKEIDGVDVTQAMMDRVDLSNNNGCEIRLHNHDTGTFPVEPGTYDIATGYSFLHHLYDVVPTIKTAYTALKKGGKLYADLEPNYYYWESINSLDRSGVYDPMVKREIEMVTYKDEDIEKNFGVSKDTFNNAEFGKNIRGGFREEELRKTLADAGFSKVDVFYYWYLGQASIINDDMYPKEDRFNYAQVVNTMLQRALPVSKNLFKYLGFVATK